MKTDTPPQYTLRPTLGYFAPQHPPQPPPRPNDSYAPPPEKGYPPPPPPRQYQQPPPEKSYPLVQQYQQPPPPQGQYYYPPDQYQSRDLNYNQVQQYQASPPLSNSNGWEIMIDNKILDDDYKIFISKDSYDKYSSFLKKNKSREVIDLQQQGFGVPIFKVEAILLSFHDKFLNFKRYLPTSSHPFNHKKDYYDFCLVKKFIHMNYDSYVFEFKPDPNNRNFDFKIVMFSHQILPINDYLYKGVKHRWINDSYEGSIKRIWNLRYSFTHTILNPNQISLTDNWDGKSNKLDRKLFKNPYLGGLLKKIFNLNSSFPKPEYYGYSNVDTLRETDDLMGFGHADLNINNSSQTNSNISHESIFSLSEDELVSICIATTLKRQQDLDREESDDDV